MVRESGVGRRNNWRGNGACGGEVFKQWIESFPPVPGKKVLAGETSLCTWRSGALPVGD